MRAHGLEQEEEFPQVWELHSGGIIVVSASALCACRFLHLLNEIVGLFFLLRCSVSETWEPHSISPLTLKDIAQRIQK